jgi:hypothetical protein
MVVGEVVRVVPSQARMIVLDGAKPVPATAIESPEPPVTGLMVILERIVKVCPVVPAVEDMVWAPLLPSGIVMLPLMVPLAVAVRVVKGVVALSQYSGTVA